MNRNRHSLLLFSTILLLSACGGSTPVKESSTISSSTESSQVSVSTIESSESKESTVSSTSSEKVSSISSEESELSSSVSESSVESSSEESTILPPVEEHNPNLLFKMDFSDTTNIGKNVIDNEIGDAIAEGLNASNIATESIHGNNRLNVDGRGKRRVSYIDLPTEAFNYEKVTFAGWFFYPKADNQTWRNEFAFANEDTNRYFRTVPLNTNNFESYSLVTNILNGTEQDLTFITTDSTRNPTLEDGWPSAFGGSIQPVFDAWYHMSYEFTPTSLTVYQNSHLVWSYNGDFDLSKINISTFRLGANLSDQDEDYNGSYADIRVYKDALTSEQIKEEYQLEDKDFLTAKYSFKDEASLNDEVRGYKATKYGNAAFQQKEGKDALYLDGSVSENVDARSSVTVENGLLFGHSELSVSTNLYLPAGDQMYKRIFEYSVGGKRSISLFIGFGTANNIRFEYARNAWQDVRDVIQPDGYTLPTERWINITVTTDGVNGYIYVDGEKIGEGSFGYKVAPLWCWFDLYFDIGRTRFYNDGALNGYIESMSLYNTCLSQESVKNIIGVQQNA